MRHGEEEEAEAEDNGYIDDVEYAEEAEAAGIGQRLLIRSCSP